MLLVFGSLLVIGAVAQSYFPNLGYLGETYDIVKGNPRFMDVGVDPGWMAGIQVFEYNYSTKITTADKRHFLPFGVSAISDLSCSYSAETNEIQGMTSYHKDLEVKASVEVGYEAIGSFTASSTWKTVEDITNQKHSILITAEASCTVYSASITQSLPPQLSAAWKKAVHNMAANKQSAIDVAREFGTHYSTSVVMGAAFTMHSAFDYTKYTKMTESNFDFELGAKASLLGYTGETSGSTKKEQDAKKEFEDTRTLLRFTFVGSRPSTDGKWSTWAQYAGKNPVPSRFTLAPLSNLISHELFPEIPQATVTKIRSQLAAVIANWCHNPGATCTIPADHVYPVEQELVNSGQNGVVVYCPKGFKAISAGLGNRDNSKPQTIHPAFVADSATAVCYDVAYAECHALCMSEVTTASIVSPYTTVKPVTTSCPKGFVVTSCGYCSLCNHGTNNNWEVHPDLYPSSDTACTSYDYFGHLGYTSCVSENDLVSGSYQRISKYGKNRFSVSCPAGKVVLGCGYQSDRNVGTEKYWWIKPNLASNGCDAYNFFGATAWVICATFKGHVQIINTLNGIPVSAAGTCHESNSTDPSSLTISGLDYNSDSVFV
jgi:hypothetical protein